MSSLRDQIANALWGSPTNGDARKAADVVMSVVVPFITNLDVVPLDAPCVECGEAFDPGDRVTWRLRYAPQGLIHEECK